MKYKFEFIESSGLYLQVFEDGTKGGLTNNPDNIIDSTILAESMVFGKVKDSVIERSYISKTSKISRSKIIDSTVLKGDIEDSEIKDSMISRSTVKQSKVSQSSIGPLSSIVNSEVKFGSHESAYIDDSTVIFNGRNSSTILHSQIEGTGTIDYSHIEDSTLSGSIILYEDNASCKLTTNLTTPNGVDKI